MFIVERRRLFSPHEPCSAECCPIVIPSGQIKILRKGCGSGSGRIQMIFPDPENKNPDPGSETCLTILFEQI